MPPAKRWSGVRFLIIIACSLICTAVTAIGLTIWWLRSEAIANAYRDSGNLATVLGGQISNSVHSIDLVLDEVRTELLERRKQSASDFGHVIREDSTHRFLMDRLSHLPQAVLVGIVDKNGILANTTQEWPLPKIDVSDAPHYGHFRTIDDKGVYISKLQIGRILNKKVVFFSKRIDDDNNQFLGVVVVGVGLAYFHRVYESIQLVSDQSFLLLHSDGSIIARYPEAPARTFDRMPSESLWYPVVSRGGGQYRSPGYFDNNARLVAVHPLSNYPLVVNVGVSEEAALATWRVEAVAISIGTLLVTFCSGLFLNALRKHFRLLADSEAALLKKSQELQQANVTIDAAVNNMSQGLVMFDPENRLVVCNKRYLEMYGLSSTVIKPGIPLQEILEHRITAGQFFNDKPEEYVAEILENLEREVTFTKLTTLSDGRVIAIVNHPVPGGGWVATHEDVTDAKRTEERISYAAHHDTLTGLPNRKLFSEQLEHALKVASSNDQVAVLYLDLDHLKRINDTLGHSIGDKLLKSVADRLRGCVRDIDLVARLSGDEFAIIQKSINGRNAAAELATRVREAIHEPFDLDHHKVIVDISVGISIAPDDATELKDLLKTADIALYEAKNTGRGVYRFYEPEMNARMQARSAIERDLQTALTNGEFELHYQPIVDVNENKIKSFEALLRWRHPVRGLVSPLEIIPVAEEMGLIVPLGEWILRTACSEAANWPEDIGIAVNVSAVQLTHKNLSNAVVGAVSSAGIRADRLILEITESAFLEDTFATLATLKRLHEIGVRFSMDDFGTGYSSLSYLLSFPFSKIKIDRSFVADLAKDKNSRAIVRAIVDLARNLKMRVIAEGVETGRQLEQLRRLGCHEIQGYLFSAARPAAEIQRFFVVNPDVLKDKGNVPRVA